MGLGFRFSFLGNSGLGFWVHGLGFSFLVSSGLNFKVLHCDNNLTILILTFLCFELLFMCSMTVSKVFQFF